MEHKDYDLVIRIAGNTAIPCLAAIKSKGYKVSLTHYRDSEFSDWNAEKDNRLFSATSIEELLGLIAMWEVRGDVWRTKDSEHREIEHKEYEQLRANAEEYYHDEDGYPHIVKDE